MDFGAGTAGACIAHLPEVIVLISVEDVVGGQMLCPDRGSLVVAGKPFVGSTFEHGGIKARGIEFEHVNEVFPCHVDGFGLEVVAERPVAEHLEHGVMVGVETHFLEVVVLAADAETLLRVGHATRLRHCVS